MKGIIFTENIDKIMDGTKTETRRVIKPKYSNTHIDWFTNKYGKYLCEIQNDVEGETFGKNDDGTSWFKVKAVIELSPRYHPGEIVYVREAFATSYKDQLGMTQLSDKILYKADGNYAHINWRSPMLMPETAARTFLLITAERAERIQDITDADAISEGIIGYEGWQSKEYKLAKEQAHKANSKPPLGLSPREQYRHLWNKLNGKDGGAFLWDMNPWVRVYTFRLAENIKETAQPAGAYADQPTLQPAT